MIKIIAALSVAFAAHVFLPATARSAGLESLTARGDGDFEKVRLRFLKPRGDDGRDVTASVVMGGSRQGEGDLLAVEVEAPLGNGWSIPTMIGGLAHSVPARQGKDGRWTQKSMGAGPSAGLRKRLFQVGVGNAKGDGVFLEPYVEVGAAPFAGYSDLTADTKEQLSTPSEKRWGVVDTKRGANPMTLAGGGVDMHLKDGWAVGMQYLRAAPLFIKDHAADFFNFSLKKDF